MSLPRKVLTGWTDLGRYPDLLLLVGRGDEGSVAPEEALRWVLEGMASPRTHREGFAELLERGEFRAAEAILATEPSNMSPAGLEIGTLKVDLARARQQAQDEAQLRIVSLGRRAELVGLPPATPAGVEEAARDSRGGAADLFGQWEARIKEEEARRSGTFLQGDAAVGSGDAGPAQVPRRPPWPWAAKGSAVLGWYHDEGRAPADFHARWKPAPDDAGATAILAALGQLQGGVTTAAVTAFAAAFDAFLGHEGPAARAAVEHAEGVETRLFALADWRLPCLAASGGGVRLWVPRSAVAGPPPGGAPGLVLCFSERLPSRTEPGLVWFDLAGLLRLIPERQHRLVNFLRDIGNRVPLAQAVPSGIDLSALPSRQAGEAGAFVRWVLDILNVKAQDAALADMVVYYTGGEMELLLPLLRSLLESHPNRQIPLTQAALASAWESESFREPAQVALLQPLTNDPLARAALGAILYLGQPPAWSVTPEEVVLAAEDISGKEIDEAKIREAIGRLVTHALLVKDSDGGEYRPPTSGTVSLLLAAIPDIVAFVRTALAAR